MNSPAFLSRTSRRLTYFTAALYFLVGLTMFLSGVGPLRILR